MKVTVQRGFIMRFHPDPSFEEELEDTPMPAGADMPDSDAMPYYEKHPDGTWRESYRGVVPAGVEIRRQLSEAEEQ